MYFGGGSYPLFSGSNVLLYYNNGGPGWSGPSMTGFRSVQRGTIDIIDEETVTTATLGTALVDVSKADLTFLGAGGELAESTGATSNGAWLSDLTTTSVKANRKAPTVATVTTVGYQIVEYY